MSLNIQEYLILLFKVDVDYHSMNIGCNFLEMTAKSACFVNEEVAQQGYLKKLKTGKRRYFILKKTSRHSKGCLQYFGSRKKAFLQGAPNKVIYMKDCFHIGQIEERKHPYAFALFTNTERFGLIAESHAALEGWLSALEFVRRECLDLEDPLGYTEIWSVKIKDEGLGRSQSIHGQCRLGLKDDKLVILKNSCQKLVHEIHLKTIRRSGLKGRFVFMELGENNNLGAGELWIELDEASIAEHMKKAIFGSCNRPRSLTDGNQKDKQVESGVVFSRTSSGSRNKIGSNFMTVTLPHLSSKKDESGKNKDGVDWRNQSNLSRGKNNSRENGKRPLTLDLENISFSGLDLGSDTLKRKTMSMTDLLDDAPSSAPDSDHNNQTDDELDEDQQDIPTQTSSTRDDLYETMNSSPPKDEETVENKEKNTQFSLSKISDKRKREGNVNNGNETNENIYETMEGRENPNVTLDNLTAVTQRQSVSPVYCNITTQKTKEKGNINDTSNHIDCHDSIDKSLSAAVSHDAQYTECYGAGSRRKTHHVEQMIHDIKPPGSSLRMSDIRKSLTLSPRSLRRKGEKLANTPTSCFYVDIPYELKKDSTKEGESARESTTSSDSENFSDHGPHYVNFPRTESFKMEISNERNKPRALKHKNSTESQVSGGSEVREFVSLRKKSNEKTQYEDMTFDHKCPGEGPVFERKGKVLRKQVSLPPRKVVTPELTHKRSDHVLHDYVNVSVPRSASKDAFVYERNKTRQGKTAVHQNRTQVYSDFVLPFESKKVTPVAEVKETASFAPHCEYPERCRPESGNSSSTDASAASDLAPSRKLGKTVSYENLLDEHHDFMDRKKASHGLSYADLQFSSSSKDTEKELVSIRHFDGLSRRQKMKMSRSCDDIFARSQNDKVKVKDEVSHSPISKVTYMDVDIERSQILAEEVRKQRGFSTEELGEASLVG